MLSTGHLQSGFLDQQSSPAQWCSLESCWWSSNWCLKVNTLCAIFKELGRRFPSVQFCISYVSIPFVDMPVVVQVLAFGGKMGVSCSFGVVFLFLTELIPTVVRNMGLGAITTVAHTGTIICPYILYLGKCFLFLSSVGFHSNCYTCCGIQTVNFSALNETLFA